MHIKKYIHIFIYVFVYIYVYCIKEKEKKREKRKMSTFITNSFFNFLIVFKRENTTIDITQQIDTFKNEIDKKKNRKDSDVKIFVTAIKR